MSYIEYLWFLAVVGLVKFPKYINYALPHQMQAPY